MHAYRFTAFAVSLVVLAGVLATAVCAQPLVSGEGRAKRQRLRGDRP